MAAKVRAVTSADACTLAGIIRGSFRDVAVWFGLTRANCATHASFCTCDQVADAMGRGVEYFLLEADGQLCGCVGLEQPAPDLCYMERLGVLPAVRGRGYGTLLARHAMAEARERGAARVSIGIIAEQAELRAWYERRGFAVTGTRQFDHLPFTVAFMETDLARRTAGGAPQ